MNKSKRIGTDFEVKCVAFLKEHGFDAERRAQAGRLDKGDIRFDPYIAECKATQAIALAEGMNELESEIANAGVNFGFLLIKRRRKSIGDAYAVMSLRQLVALLKEVK